MVGSLNRKSARDRLVVTQIEKVHKELFEDFVKLAKSMLTHEPPTSAVAMVGGGTGCA